MSTSSYQRDEGKSPAQAGRPIRPRLLVRHMLSLPTRPALDLRRPSLQVVNFGMGHDIAEQEEAIAVKRDFLLRREVIWDVCGVHHLGGGHGVIGEVIGIHDPARE